MRDIGTQVRSYPRARAAVHFASLFGWLCRRLCKSSWLERSGASLEYVTALATEFPMARFVHVARDGRDCAYSMAHHPTFQVKLARLLARDPRLPIADCLRRPIAADRFGAYWSSLMLRQARKLHELGPERVLLLRYEELTHSPDQQLARVARFLDFGDAVEWVRSARQHVQTRPPRWSSLPTSERLRLERACLPGMRMLERLR
jgi:putative sulfotransferase